MRKSVILLLSAVMISVTGCDFFRAVAGRPVSKDIEAKRLAIMKAEEAALQARLDSIARAEEAARVEAEKALQDSVDAYRYIAENGVTLLDAARLRGVKSDELDGKAVGSRYRVIVGSFRERNNAVAFMDRISKAGDFRPHLITFGNGMVAVAACPSDRVQDAVWGHKELKKHPVCPADAWILKCE
jgi:hypothetical protein